MSNQDETTGVTPKVTNITIGGPVAKGETCTIDHFQQTFVVKVRSLSGVHSGQLKDHIEKKFEVLDIYLIEGLVVSVAPVHPDSFPS